MNEKNDKQKYLYPDPVSPGELLTSEEYEFKYGVKLLSDEEFEKLKQEAELTRKERLKDLYMGSDDFFRKLGIEEIQRQEENKFEVPTIPGEKPLGWDKTFYERITISLEAIRSFFRNLKGKL